MSALDAQLLTAHADNDLAALVSLYTDAAAGAEDEDAQRFYLTHAFVFALELGDARADALRTRLVALGSEPAAP